MDTLTAQKQKEKKNKQKFLFVHLKTKMSTQLFSSFPGKENGWWPSEESSSVQKLSTHTLDFNKEPMRCIIILKMWISFIVFKLFLQPPKILLPMNRSNLWHSSIQAVPTLIRRTESGYCEINLKEVLFLVQDMGIMFPDIIKQMQ